MNDDRQLFYTGVIADASEKYILIERLHSRKLNPGELRQEYIELDKILSAELKKYNVPLKEVSVTFSDESTVPNYISYKYARENRAKPSALTVLLPFLLP